MINSPPASAEARCVSTEHRLSTELPWTQLIVLFMANIPLPKNSMNNTVPSSQPAINCPECSHIEHILY